MSLPGDEARLTGDDPAAARAAALELGDRRASEAVPAMLEVLATTTHHDVRNGVAYALSAMRVPELVEVIATLLGQDRTRGARGTLLYALRPYDCSPILPLLVDLVIEDGWEASREAAWLITEMESVDAELWIRLRGRLRSALGAADPERRELIRFLLDFFEEEPAGH